MQQGPLSCRRQHGDITDTGYPFMTTKEGYTQGFVTPAVATVIR